MNLMHSYKKSTSKKESRLRWSNKIIMNAVTCDQPMNKSRMSCFQNWSRNLVKMIKPSKKIVFETMFVKFEFEKAKESWKRFREYPAGLVSLFIFWIRDYLHVFLV